MKYLAGALCYLLGLEFHWMSLNSAHPYGVLVYGLVMAIAIMFATSLWRRLIR